MPEFLLQYGLFSLFLVSFLAATLLPLGSEWFFIVLLLNGTDPALSVTVATLGNTLGACSTYWIGLSGSPFLITRVLRIDEAARLRAERFYSTYGSWSLFFSWLPVVGDPLCLVGGLLKVRFARFSLLVLSGKLFRYGGLALATFLF